jgi:hypothetical protein
MPFKFPNYKIDFIEAMNHSATQSFGLGVGAAVSVIMLGYGVVWLGWWATKRWNLVP